MFEKPNQVPGVFEFVNVGPDFSLPGFLVTGRLTASGTAGVQSDGRRFDCADAGSPRSRQFNEDAPDFLDFLVRVEQVFVA
jgi:hypothetical protein